MGSRPREPAAREREEEAALAFPAGRLAFDLLG
jgi:hypothetical protein